MVEASPWMTSSARCVLRQPQHLFASLCLLSLPLSLSLLLCFSNNIAFSLSLSLSLSLSVGLRFLSNTKFLILEK